MKDPDRIIAARHLREARRLGGSDALEAVAWARCAAPRSIRTIALEARLLIEHDDPVEADALIAQGLLLAPMDPELLMLHARRLLERGMADRAQRVIDLALPVRPRHVGLHRLAARIARSRGDASRAAELLDNVARSHPAPPRPLLVELVLAYFDLERFEETRVLLSALAPPSPYLESILAEHDEGPLAALDRLVLDRTLSMSNGRVAPVNDDANVDSTDRVLERIIDLAERVGDQAQLYRALDDVTFQTPRALRRAARAWLRAGRFEAVIDRLSSPVLGAAEQGRRRSDPAPADFAILSAIAHLALGQVNEAEELLSQQPRRDEGRSPSDMAEAWRDALIGLLRRGVSRPHERHPLNGTALVGAFLTDVATTG